VLASVLPLAQSRGMKTFCWYEDVFRSDIEGIDRLQEVTLSGNKRDTLCFHNPEVQAFWTALTEDYLRSYPVDGIMWGSERQGPFGNAIGAKHGGAQSDPFEVACFCNFCHMQAKSRGIDVQRAGGELRRAAHVELVEGVSVAIHRAPDTLSAAEGR